MQSVKKIFVKNQKKVISYEKQKKRHEQRGFRGSRVWVISPSVRLKPKPFDRFFLRKNVALKLRTHLSRLNSANEDFWTSIPADQQRPGAAFSLFHLSELSSDVEGFARPRVE